MLVEIDPHHTSQTCSVCSAVDAASVDSDPIQPACNMRVGLLERLLDDTMSVPPGRFFSLQPRAPH
jgi:hypothetical protein